MVRLHQRLQESKSAISNDQLKENDSPKTLKQKAEFANQKCLGGLFGWDIDLGGLESLTNPNELSPNATSIDGANLDGDNRSGDVSITADIYLSSSSHVVTATAPVSFILPPFILPTPTTISFQLYTTSLEVAWPTSSSGIVNRFTTWTPTIGRTIETKTITIPPVTSTAITLGNVRSILPPLITLVNDENPTSKTGISYPPVTRTLTLPPFLYETTLTLHDLPTLTFTPGPLGPKCTANCGSKCEGFCSALCLVDCEGSNHNGFIGPSDPDPPSHEKSQN